MQDAVATLHLISEPTRFNLLKLLFEHPYCVRALAKKMGISEAAVSQHMNQLKKYQVVYGVKQGYQTHYQINEAVLNAAFTGVLAEIGQYAKTRAKVADCACEFLPLCIKQGEKNRRAKE